MDNLVEIAARAHYESYFAGVIGCTEPPWKNLPDNDGYKARFMEAARAVLSALRAAGAIREWRPISEARTQSTYLVGNSAYSGWFAIAQLNALREWRVPDGQDQLPYPPTHFQPLPQPPEER